MFLNDKLAFNKLLDVINSGANDVHWTWKADVIIENVSYPLYSFIGSKVISDYTGQFYDKRRIKVKVPIDLAILKIIPNKSNLKVTLTRRLSDQTGNNSITNPSTATIYDAYLLDSDSLELTLSNLVSTNDLSQLRDFVDLNFQLVETGLITFRGIEEYGNFRDCTLTDLIRGLMTQEINGEQFNVDVQPMDNDRLYKNFLLPSGVKLPKLPKYLQECDTGGLYKNGLGYYHRNKTTYIYPIYDFERFNDTKRTLTILNVPESEMPVAEITYRRSVDAVEIIALGDIKHLDVSELSLNQQGNAIRYANLDNIHNSFYTHVDGLLEIPKGLNRNEVSVEDRPKANHVVNTVDGYLTDNHYDPISKMKNGVGAYVTLDWQSSDHELLYPGMPTKLYYLAGGELKQVYGTLVNATTVTEKETDSVTSTLFVSSTKLTIFCERL